MTERAVDKLILQAVYGDPDCYRTAIGLCAQKARLEQCGKIARGWGLTQVSARRCRSYQSNAYANPGPGSHDGNAQIRCDLSCGNACVQLPAYCFVRFFWKWTSARRPWPWNASLQWLACRIRATPPKAIAFSTAWLISWVSLTLMNYASCARRTRNMSKGVLATLSAR